MLLCSEHQFFPSGIFKVFVVGNDSEPVSATVDTFSIGAIAARKDFFAVELKVAKVVHEGGWDDVSRCVHCAVRTSPIVLWDGEEGCAFEVESSLTVGSCGAFEEEASVRCTSIFPPVAYLRCLSWAIIENP